jgi:alpha-D-xyloside xylohydrolase
MAGSLRGGLHLGLSGFGFWSHDVPGFHGAPDFMASWPEDDLYVRWTQFGVFTSHLRYHGATPREPYAYPEVADVVRTWLKLRYALIPYLLQEAETTTQTGMPLLRALLLHHEDDPVCWHIDDAYYFGGDILAAPVMNAEGIRDVYLPAGAWVDLWTGKQHQGPKWLKGLHVPLERMPVYVRHGAEIPIYPESIASTEEIDLAKTVKLAFDDEYDGISRSILGKVTGF